MSQQTKAITNLKLGSDATVTLSWFGWQKRARIPVNTSGGEAGSSARSLQQLPPVLAEFTGWSDMPVEGLPGDAELAAQVADVGLLIGHGGAGEAKLGRGHLVGPTALAAAGSGGQ